MEAIDALGAAGVRDGLQLGRSVQAAATGGRGHMVCRHAHSLLTSVIHSRIEGSD